MPRTKPGTGTLDIDRLVKILSLTRSDKEGEAVAAFLMARCLLAKSGLTLADVLVPETAADGGSSRDPVLMRLEIESLRRRVASLTAELADTSEQLARHRTAFGELVGTVWSLHDGSTPGTVN